MKALYFLTEPFLITLHNRSLQKTFKGTGSSRAFYMGFYLIEGTPPPPSLSFPVRSSTQNPNKLRTICFEVSSSVSLFGILHIRHGYWSDVVTQNICTSDGYFPYSYHVSTFIPNTTNQT